MNFRNSIPAAVLLLAAGGGHSAQAAAPLAAESRIAAATVYVDRAIVTRKASVTLAIGAREVLFAGLPHSLDPDLLQVSGSGTAAATILDVRAVPSQLALAANPRLAALLEQARGLEAEVRRLDDRRTVLREQRDYLDKIRTASVTPPAAQGAALPKLGEWQELFRFYSEGIARVLGETQELDGQREEVQAKLAAVQREIKDLQAPGQRAVKDVIVRLDVAEAGGLDLSLDYTVGGASWSPTYDVRVDSAGRAIVLGYAGMVRQSTGEDWNDVELVLSTARPAIGGTPPELLPWYVGERRPIPLARSPEAKVELMPFALDANRRERPAEGLADAAPRSAGMARATVETGLTAATFTIPYPADIPADNAPHKVSITSHPLEGELSHLAVPKLAELAYLRAAVKNTSGFPLLAGPVNLYLDGTYVARSQLATVMPEEKFELDLGVDDGVSVERKLVNRLVENTGLVTRRQRVTYAFVITVQNNRPTAGKIVVKDQVPISQHEKITVDLLTPQGKDVEKDEHGILTWTLNLKPGEIRTLPLRFAVEHPADFPISGLE